VQADGPVVTLHDTFLDQKDSLNRFFEEELKLEDAVVTFSLGSHEFALQHLRLRTAAQKPTHSLVLCAQGRAVEEVPLTERVPVLSGALLDPEKDARFVYAGCLS